MGSDYESKFSFWQWFFRGTANDGWRLFVSINSLTHAVIAIILSTLIAKDLASIAGLVILPLAGVLVGMTFAWGANAYAIIQTKEIRLLAKQRSGGVSRYAYLYQLAILVILTTLILWGIIALFADKDFKKSSPICNFVFSFVLWFLTSLSVNECWSTIEATRSLLMARIEIEGDDVKSGESQ